jgi:hypothetical protein
MAQPHACKDEGTISNVIYTHVGQRLGFIGRGHIFVNPERKTFDRGSQVSNADINPSIVNFRGDWMKAVKRLGILSMNGVE